MGRWGTCAKSKVRLSCWDLKCFSLSDCISSSVIQSCSVTNLQLEEKRSIFAFFRHKSFPLPLLFVQNCRCLKSHYHNDLYLNKNDQSGTKKWIYYNLYWRPAMSITNLCHICQVLQKELFCSAKFTLNTKKVVVFCTVKKIQLRNFNKVNIGFSIFCHIWSHADAGITCITCQKFQYAVSWWVGTCKMH